MNETLMAIEKPDANTGVELKRWGAHQHEEEILNRQLNGSSVKAVNGTVFAYAAPVDIAVLGLSAVAAIIAGALNPLLTVSLLPASCSHSIEYAHRYPGHIWPACWYLSRIF